MSPGAEEEEVEAEVEGGVGVFLSRRFQAELLYSELCDALDTQG